MKHALLVIFTMVAVGILAACNVQEVQYNGEPTGDLEVLPCEEVDCGENGACEEEGGEAVCVCDAGFEGSDCSECAAEYFEEDGQCIASESCEDFEGFCGESGTCDDSSNLVECLCEEGYGGEDCSACAEGYFESEGECFPNIVCEEADPCGDYGSCEDSDAGVICDCAEGYAGDRCTECDADHYLLEEVCVPNEVCEADACSGHGICDDSSGQISCDCDATYAGESCEACWDGYVLIGGECTLAETCQAGSCFGNGTCDDDTGAVVCSCEFGYGDPYCQDCAAGYEGDDCTTCSVGYELVGDECLNICGDGITVETEVCDDGNTDPSNGVSDFCSTDCQFSNWPADEWPGYVEPTVGGGSQTWSQMSVEGNSSRYEVVEPGETVDVAGRFVYDAGATGCAGCVNQFYLGWFSEDETNEDPIEGAVQWCTSFGGSKTENINITVDTPTEPGTYYLRWTHTWLYICNTTMGRPGMGRSLFIIHVDE